MTQPQVYISALCITNFCSHSAVAALECNLQVDAVKLFKELDDEIQKMLAEKLPKLQTAGTMLLANAEEWSRLRRK